MHLLHFEGYRSKRAIYIILWRKNIETKVEMNFSLEDARTMVVKQLIDEDAKRLFSRKIEEITNDTSRKETRERSGSLHCIHSKQLKYTRKPLLWSHQMRFGIMYSDKASLGSMSIFTRKKRFMHCYKFKMGNRIREHWQRLKDLNGYLPYFPLNI